METNLNSIVAGNDQSIPFNEKEVGKPPLTPLDMCVHIAKRLVTRQNPLRGLDDDQIKKLRKMGLLSYGEPKLTGQGEALITKHGFGLLLRDPKELAGLSEEEIVTQLLNDMPVEKKKEMLEQSAVSNANELIRKHNLTKKI